MPAPEAEASLGALSTDGLPPAPLLAMANALTGAMASTAPADAELLDDADTEAAAASSDRYTQNLSDNRNAVLHACMHLAT